MKLQDLETLRPQDKAVHILESRLGQKLPLAQMSISEAQYMLKRVRCLIAEHRSTPAFHRSEQDSAYLSLVMIEQGISAHITEQQDSVIMMPIDTKDPKVQQTLKKAQSGQNLTPDETKIVTAMATQKKESAKAPRRMVKESELQQAQVVLAAQDMIDRIQGMIEDISEMQFKDLPALTDSVKNDMGVDQATQFQSATSAALSQLLTAIQEGKVQMESAQGVLTGQAPIVPGDDTDLNTELDTDGVDDVDVVLDIDADLPLREDEQDDEEEFSTSLGRERR